jgi:hypothetical protein
MKTHTHTQGPWHPVTLGASPDHSWAIDSELHEVARLPEWPDNQAEAEANARLIAAAPEMLAALEELCADKYLADPINADRMGKAKAAIAKAKGGEA